LGLVLLLLLSLSVYVLAAQGDPATFFTDNIAATEPSLAVTVMEQELLDRLNGATGSIDVAIYSLSRVSIRDALIAAHNRGVTVRVVADDDAYHEAGHNPHFQALQTAGIPLVLDNRSSLMHNKFFIIDSQVVWSGSTNITNTGFSYNHNNSLVFTSTQLAAIYRTEFEEMFVSGLFGTAKTDNTSHTLTYAGLPLEIYFSPSDSAMAELLSEVAEADESIYFSIFSFTDDNLRDALIARKQAGVTVTGIFDALSAGNQYSEDETLCQAGIPIKVEQFGGKMHHKFMVIDANGTDPVVVTGSMNWSASGDQANDENTLIIHDPQTAQVYYNAYQTLYQAMEAGPPCMIVDPNHMLYLPLIIGAPAAQPTPTPIATATSVPQPTTTPTTSPPTPDIKITFIEYNPDGDDVIGEFVRIQNLGSAAQLMTGWTLSDESAHVYSFPTFTLAAGGTVQIWTKSGTDTTTDLYWGSSSAIWNNTGDTATLKSDQGQIVSSCGYGDGGTSATCQ
jgi:hypothetical protein